MYCCLTVPHASASWQLNAPRRDGCAGGQDGLALCRVDEAQERAVGRPRATQASPRHTAPLPPLREWRGLSTKKQPCAARGAHPPPLLGNINFTPDPPNKGQQVH